ncbi:PREDICTED: uncharacterized protein LOC105619861 [Atta cephalotes]|uniref:DNA endonuclease activator Ctp1 C-terminal domain-containing protein n=1 Tax=Atta cephalotes TaxID=12957 RepID=A0A158NGW1_ATTCE|nr:PREDICTED: uncharacterized protein LOC105619861 [Atta cephalotes]
MSIILQFNCLTQNETARKAMESYVEILQKAFEHYQNLWEDYIKLQEKYKQCNALHSSSQVTIDTKIKNEVTSQQSNNADEQENSSTPSCIPLLRLVTNSIDFNSDTEPSLSDKSEFLHKDTNENNRPESPIFSKIRSKTGAKSVKKLRLSKMLCSDSTSDMKTHHGEKVSSKYNHKLEISTTHHVETTFLPDGKRLKQSRLAFHPVKNNENTILASNVDKHKPVNRLYNVEQNFTEEISIVKDAEEISTENASITASTKKDATNNSIDISEDVIEVSPTQKNITSKVKRRLKLKRKNPARSIIKNSPNKNKYLNHRPDPSVPETINVDFGLCPSPKYTSTQIDNDKSLTNTVNTVKTLKDKVSTNYLSPIKMDNKTNVQIKHSIETQKEDLLLIQNFNNIKDFAYEDEFFDLPVAAKKNNIANLKDETDDSENKPPEKKMLLNKFKVFPKRKADVPEQRNMQCKADREKLNGFDCWECRKYYQNLSLSKEELKKRLNQCSRHRHKYERPNTPEGFWDPEFPETLSCTYRQ